MNIRQLFRGPTSTNCIHSSAYSDDLYFRDSLESNAPLPFDVLRGSKVNKQLHVRVDNTENINVSTYRSNPRLDSGYIRLFSSTQESIVIPQLEIDRYKWLVNAKRATLEQMSVEQRFGLRVGNVLDDSPKSIFDFDRLIYYTDVKKNSNGVYETTDDCERKQFSEWQGVDSIDEIWCNKDAYKPIIREQFEDKLMGTPTVNNSNEMIPFHDSSDFFSSLLQNAYNQGILDASKGQEVVEDIDYNEAIVQEPIDHKKDYDFESFKAKIKEITDRNPNLQKCRLFENACSGYRAFIKVIEKLLKLLGLEAYFKDNGSGKQVFLRDVLINCSSIGEKLTEFYEYIATKYENELTYSIKGVNGEEEKREFDSKYIHLITDDLIDRVVQFIRELSTTKIKDADGKVIMDGFIFDPSYVQDFERSLRDKINISRKKVEDDKRSQHTIDGMFVKKEG